jgi:hypothetical protein
MRATQFWILLIASACVSLLCFKQILLSRTLDQQQRAVVDSEEIASTSTVYEASWKKLAIHIYKASLDDPALAEVLKREKIMIHTGTPPPLPGSSPTGNTTPAAPATSTSASPP